jgi:hypothetical protein
MQGRPFAWAASFLLLPLLAGCTGGGEVKEFTMHIGKNADGSQYLTPKDITVRKDDKVRFVITNDDKAGTPDSFHDVALLDYDGTGDGTPDDIEHEVPAGKTVKTEMGDKDYFVATTKGDFRIICEVRRNQPTSHETAGMWGNYKVT